MGFLDWLKEQSRKNVEDSNNVGDDFGDNDVPDAPDTTDVSSDFDS